MENSDNTKNIEKITCPLCKLDAFLWYERDQSTKVYSCSTTRCKAETIMVTSRGTMIGDMNGDIIYDTTSGTINSKK